MGAPWETEEDPWTRGTIEVARFGPSNATAGVLCFFRGFFWQWLGVTHASDPPVPCGHRGSCCLTTPIRIPNGIASHAAPNKSPNLFLSARYRVTRATGSDLVVNNWEYPSTVAVLALNPKSSEFCSLSARFPLYAEQWGFSSGRSFSFLNDEFFREV